MVQGFGKKNRFIVVREVRSLFVDFGDFIVDPARLNVLSFVDGGSVNIHVALSPNSKAEVPELENQVGGQVCGGVPIMELAFALIIIMCAEPG